MNKPLQATKLREGFQPEGAQAAPLAVAPNPSDPQAEPETWPLKVKLMHSVIRDPSKPGDEIRELSFRQPTAGDINRCGNPCRVDSNGDLQVDEKKMTMIMANLSGVLSPLLDQMDARDWSTCRWRLQRFFLPDWAQVFQGTPTS
jgi:Phage tail assembly chaperone proteins, E, or 41 or 14